MSVGVAQPLGATCTPTGVNFSIYSEHASSVTLLLFDSHRAKTPDHEIVLNARDNKSFHFWHCHVAGVGPGQVYAYRVDGPFDPTGTGLRFNRNKVLIDPYALGNIDNLWDRDSAVGPQDNVATSMRSVVIDPTAYDWEGDEPLNIPLSETIIYEMHVRGFTKSPSSDVRASGHVPRRHREDPVPQVLWASPRSSCCRSSTSTRREILRVGPTGRAAHNYWGYDPYAPLRTAVDLLRRPDQGCPSDEFRDMVKALHQAGIEVILDVVFNHTSEGNQIGPTISFRGLGQRGLLPALARRPAVLHGLLRLREHASTPTTRWSRSSSSTACSTG